jgi:hypothetical protein
LPALNPDSDVPPRRSSFIGFVRAGSDAVTEVTANLVRLFAEATEPNIDETASITLQMKLIQGGMSARALHASCLA